MVDEFFISRAEYVLKNNNGLPDSIFEFLFNYDYSVLYGSYDINDFFIRQGVENYILKNNNDYDVVINKAKNDFYNAFINNPEKFFDSILLKDGNAEKLFSSDQLEEIDRQKVAISSKIDSIIENGPHNDEEKRLLMSFFTDNIDINDNDQINYVSQLLDNGDRHISNEELRFLYTFVSKWMLSENGITDIDVPIYSIDFSPSDSRGGFATGSHIFMNHLFSPRDDRAYLDNLETMIHVICHETRHVIQFRSARHGDTSIVALEAISKNLLGQSFYNNNYRFSKIEQDAERVGYDMAYKFLEAFHRDDMVSHLKEIEDKEIIRRGHQYEYSIIEDEYTHDLLSELYEYGVSTSLDEAVYKDPSVVLNNPVLLKLYDEDGMVRSFEDMICNDFTKDDNSEIFYNHIVRYIQDGELDNLDIRKLSKEKQNVVINNINILIGMINNKIDMIIKGNLSDLNNVHFGEFDRNNLKPIDDIYKSEIAYYFSLANKLLTFSSNNLSKIDVSLNNNFSDNVDFLLSSIRQVKNNSQVDISDVKKFLDNYESSLSSAKKLFSFDLKNRFEKLVIPELRNVSVKYKGEIYTFEEFGIDILSERIVNDNPLTLKVYGNLVNYDEFILSRCTSYKKRLSDSDPDFSNKFSNKYDQMLAYSDKLTNKFNELIRLIRNPSTIVEERERSIIGADQIIKAYRNKVHDDEFANALLNALELAKEDYRKQTEIKDEPSKDDDNLSKKHESLKEEVDYSSLSDEELQKKLEEFKAEYAYRAHQENGLIEHDDDLISEISKIEAEIARRTTATEEYKTRKEEYEDVSISKELMEQMSLKITNDLDDFAEQERKILSAKHFTEEQKRRMIGELYSEFDEYVEANKRFK